MKTRTCVSCIIGADANLFHIANTVTGLCQLEAESLIELTLRHSSDIGQHAIVIEVDGSVAGIDLSDHSDKMLPELSNCGLYFKRCVRPEDLKLSNRIQPFGLNYACRSRKSAWRLFNLFGLSDVARRPAVWKKFLCVPLVKDFEREPAEAASPTILFQARLWNPADCPGDGRINEDRVALLLALKSEFKKRIVGGLAPTPYARRHHHDLLTSQPSRQSQYVRWARSHLISIGFRGLFGSLGFKLAEALAASQCLICEPTAAYLPDDVPLARYCSIEECITACEHYLSDPLDAMRLREQAWKYYRSAVEPGEHMKLLLDSIVVR
jgi:hypothetical protein